jgi:hypothetical protein
MVRYFSLALAAAIFITATIIVACTTSSELYISSQG